MVTPTLPKEDLEFLVNHRTGLCVSADFILLEIIAKLQAALEIAVRQRDQLAFHIMEDARMPTCDQEIQRALNGVE